MKKTQILLASLVASAMLFSACGDDEICANCTDDSGETELCADDENALDALTDNFLDNSSSVTAICITKN